MGNCRLGSATPTPSDDCSPMPWSRRPTARRCLWGWTPTLQRVGTVQRDLFSEDSGRLDHRRRVAGGACRGADEAAKPRQSGPRAGAGLASGRRRRRRRGTCGGSGRTRWRCPPMTMRGAANWQPVMTRLPSSTTAAATTCPKTWRPSWTGSRRSWPSWRRARRRGSPTMWRSAA